jgi:hypothetical protein
MLLKSIFITIIFSLSFSLFAQIPVGQWREHLPYNKTIALTTDNNRIYCATPYSIFYYEKNDQSIHKFNSINKLSDIGVSAIEFDVFTNTLVIGYENGNIDLMSKDIVFNMADIKRKPIIGNKKINHILIQNGLAYLSTDFAIVVLDIKKKEIKDTYFIGDNGKSLRINQSLIKDSIYFAATEQGLFYANLNSPNLADFQNWSRDTTLFNSTSEFSCISQYHDQIITVYKGPTYSSDTMYININNTWNKLLPHLTGPVTVLKGIGDTLIIGFEYGMVYYYSNLADSFLVFDYNQVGTSAIMPRPNDAIIDKNHVIWIADEVFALVENSKAWSYKFITPSGPYSKFAWDMSAENGRLWVVSGGYQVTGSNSYLHQGAYEFYDEIWKSYYPGQTHFLDTIYDIVSVEINPQNSNEVYLGTWGQGLIKLVDGKFNKSFDITNSSLQVASNRPGFIGISSMIFDSDGNLWVANTSTPDGISSMSADGKWKSYNLSPFVTEDMTGQIVIDDLNQKWVVLQRGKGILVYNDNSTIDNTSDDRKTLLTGSVGNGALPSSNVFCLAKDHDGEIWVGTAAGVAVFYSPELIFSGNEYDAQQIYVEQSGISQYLLESEEVTSIAIDGANRKWLATRNAGVFLMSSDGTEQIFNFTTENSPILSNNILKIEIDHISGEVYFATENGVISYRSDATLGAEVQENLNVFPNPVRPEYDGLITISGLVNNANIKITDVNGNLVYQATANGGTMTWNGKTTDGSRAATGIYLVFSTNDDGTEKTVSKILFIK